MTVLRANGLSKSFGGVHAVQRVSLDIMAGEFRAIIGPNGAGKSTLFNLLTGVLKPDQGKIEIEGTDLTGVPPYKLARRGIARTFQITSVFSDMTALENVQVALFATAGQTWRPWAPARTAEGARARELLDLVELTKLADQPAGVLSHGDQKRLELAIALAGRPRLLLLDEPTAGMTAQERLQSIRLVHRLATELGLTVVFTEHDMAVVFEVATRISVLHQGRLLTEGTPEEVRANPEVQQVYLGDAVTAIEP